MLALLSILIPIVLHAFRSSCIFFCSQLVCACLIIKLGNVPAFTVAVFTATATLTGLKNLLTTSNPVRHSPLAIYLQRFSPITSVTFCSSVKMPSCMPAMTPANAIV